ncbi:MAG: MCE family protein [Gemmatimonadaceae bacterium]|nr:MCE family protein [Gemmatimonadaceae bacterium]
MKRRDEVLVGILVTLGLIVAIAGTVWLAQGGLERGYPLYAQFPWGEGLKRGQPVLLSGVTAGYVDKVEFIPTGGVLATLRMTGSYRVPKGTRASVIPAGFFGDKSVALIPDRPNPVTYAEGDTLPVSPSPPGVDQLAAKADSIAGSVQAITDEFEKELVVGRGLAELRSTLAGTNRLVNQLGAVVTAQSRQLDATMASLRNAAGAIDPAKVDSTLKNMQSASANVVELSTELSRTSAQLSATLAKLDSGEGTAGRLLTDPALYNDVRRLVSRVDSLTLDFQRNPRRYINLSIF